MTALTVDLFLRGLIIGLAIGIPVGLAADRWILRPLVDRLNRIGRRGRGS